MDELLEEMRYIIAKVENEDHRAALGLELSYIEHRYKQEMKAVGRRRYPAGSIIS